MKSLKPRLLVRLPNWIGDTLMALPSLLSLRERGFELVLIGKAWAPDLLKALPEPIEIYPKQFGQRVSRLRDLAKRHQCDTIMLLTNSFSSALEAKAAGLKAIGFKHEMRTLLLAHSFEQNLHIHQVKRFWLLAQKTVDLAQPGAPLESVPPESIAFRVPDWDREQAAKRIASFNGPYIVLCPFAAGTIKGHSKLWPLFDGLLERSSKHPKLKHFHWVVCPGPNEKLEPNLNDRFAEQASGQFHVLKDVGLLEYAALMERAHCVIANDSGPSHLAALVAEHQVTIFGPGDPSETAPWSKTAKVLGGCGAWPNVDQVISALPLEERP
jgi:heptosyltransferase II